MSGIGLRTHGDKDLDEDKQLKATLPVRQHLMLHRIKILRGQNMSETIRIALDEYLDQLVEEATGETSEQAG